MSAPFRQYFRRRKNRRSRRNYIFFGSILSQNIMVSMLLYFNFLSESKWQIWDPIGRWGEVGGGGAGVGSTWSISAGGKGIVKISSLWGWIVRNVGRKRCVMSKELWWLFVLFLLSNNYYFFLVNIQGFVNFQPELNLVTRELDGMNQNCLETGVFKKYNLVDWGR